MVTGSFITDRSGVMVLTLKSIDTETSRIEWTHMERDQTDNFLALVAKASAAANRGLRLPELTPAARQTSQARSERQARVPFQAVMMYSRAISAQDAGNKAEALTLFQQTIDRFPDFEDAKTAKARLEAGG